MIVKDITSQYQLLITDEGDIIVLSYKYSKLRELSQWKNAYGYLCVKVNNKIITIHRIVAKCFLGECPKGKQINHIDGDKLNNVPENLEYVTPKENIRHAIKLGLHVAVDPKRSGRYKDGRCRDLNAYKLAWWHQKQEKIKKERPDEKA